MLTVPSSSSALRRKKNAHGLNNMFNFMKEKKNYKIDWKLEYFAMLGTALSA